MSEPIVIVHIPKTAGTTFAAILRRNYPHGEYFLPKVFRRADELEARLRAFAESPRPGVRFLRGHMPLSYRELLPPGLRYVTWLREPVARSWSHFRHVHTAAEREGRMPSVAEGLQNEYLPDNLQTRMLSGLPDSLTRPADEAMLDAALREVRALAFYGVMERFPESMLVAQRRLGLQTVAYTRMNVRGSRVPEEHRAALEAHNELDLVLYDTALRELEPDLAHVGARRARALATAGDALTRRRLPADPRALVYAAEYGAAGARLEADARLRRLNVHRWRRWPAVRRARGALRAARLWP